MKRALLLLVAITALAALALFLVLRREPAASAVLPVALPKAGPAPDAPRAQVADDEPTVRAPAAAAEKPASTRPSGPRSTTPTRKGAPAALVVVVVEFAGTHAPVRNALASLTYELRADEQRTERMQPLKDGRFELALPPGAHLRMLDVCGHALMLEGPRVPSNAGARFRPLHAALDTTLDAAGAELRYEVEPALDLLGVVLDAEDRHPLGGAGIDVWMPVGRRMRTDTEADGKFQLTEQGAGRALRVHCDGYLETEMLLQPADFGAREPGLVVLLERGLRVCGSVFDEHGVPVRSARLELHARGIEPNGRGMPTEDQRRAKTDEQGNFCFENVPRCAQATIFETRGSPLIVPTRMTARRELGALQSDLEGLFLLSRDGALIDLRVVRADGTPVDPSRYSCTCEDPGLCEAVLSIEPEPQQQIFVALRVPVRLVVSARARDDDPNHLLVGRRTLHLEKTEPKPPEVRIVLDEPLDVTPPASSAPELTWDDGGVLATLDLRLVDHAGKPFPAGTRMDLEFGIKTYSQLAPADSELRLRCPPSREAYRARLQIGGQSRSFDVVVPPGCSRAEQRVWIVP